MSDSGESRWWLYRSIRWIFRQLGRGYFQLTVTGVERIPARGPAILAGNHPNVLDGVLLLIVSRRRVRFLVAEEMFFHPFLHWFFEAFGCIPVYRTRTRNGDALRAAMDALERGEVIGIFPEGTTTDYGRMRVVKRGVGLLALKTGAPVVPFGMAGSADAYPTGSRLPRPRRIAVAFAPPVSYGTSTEEAIPQEVLQPVLDDVRWEIVRAMRQAGGAVRTRLRFGWIKPVQVVAAGLIVMPLVGLLHATANPSLDPGVKAREVS